MIKHVAFIMDGNRRWATAHKLPLVAGHTKGYQAIEPLIAYAYKKGIKYLTFWAFSTENWHRDKKEVTVLMHIFRRIFRSRLMKRLQDNGIRLQILGELDSFPEDIVADMTKIVANTKGNTKIIVTIALNYGGRAEILRAVNNLLYTNAKAVDEKTFASFLYTKNQPDPDLIIRTSGEERLSGFLPWQSVYSELYFPKVYWPDFTEKEFEKALEEFSRRKRRFGQ
ncbi:MAG TPA: polyprenyl diphosphate synthase [Methylomirabilota bacterium]|nr:polyprenyl diphosphate synthase [Methylomirabilota bacterium]